MNQKDRKFAHDPTEPQRRKNLSDDEVEELELAGGAEGGMQAGSAGGPSGQDDRRSKKGGQKSGQ